MKTVYEIDDVLAKSADDAADKAVDDSIAKEKIEKAQKGPTFFGLPKDLFRRSSRYTRKD